MDSFRDIEEEMIREIDIQAIERAFGIVEQTDEVISLDKAQEPTQKVTVKTKAESTRCKWTGKVQFRTAPIAIETLRRWKKRDPEVCWNSDRLRIYKCKKCHEFHIGKS